MVNFLKRVSGPNQAPPQNLAEVHFNAQVIRAYPRASDLEEALRMIFEDENPELMDHLVWKHDSTGGVRCYAPDATIAERISEVASMLAALGASIDN